MYVITLCCARCQDAAWRRGWAAGRGAWRRQHTARTESGSETWTGFHMLWLKPRWEQGERPTILKASQCFAVKLDEDLYKNCTKWCPESESNWYDEYPRNFCGARISCQSHVSSWTRTEKNKDNYQQRAGQSGALFRCCWPEWWDTGRLLMIRLRFITRGIASCQTLFDSQPEGCVLFEAIRNLKWNFPAHPLSGGSKGGLSNQGLAI